MGKELDLVNGRPEESNKFAVRSLKRQARHLQVSNFKLQTASGIDVNGQSA
jgi:hypothetical protein